MNGFSIDADPGIRCTRLDLSCLGSHRSLLRLARSVTHRVVVPPAMMGSGYGPRYPITGGGSRTVVLPRSVE